MKINKCSLKFPDESKELFVVVSVTNWNEPPRIRHEISHQLARRHNVLYLQLYQNAGAHRAVKKIHENLIVDRVGFGFRGMGRLFKYFPVLHKVYNTFLAKKIEWKLKQYTQNDFSTLVNFQYDFPEVNEISSFQRKVYFCNDDFVSQDLNSSESEIRRKNQIQSDVVMRSDKIITVSYPLKEKLQRYGKAVDVVLSGHNFNLDISRCFKVQRLKTINVCYMGFLNHGIATDWLEFILNSDRVCLTIIGPIEIPEFKERIKTFSNAKHVEHLTGIKLQMEMLKHDIMLMPYSSPVENAVTTVPAKLFQYLAVGKPIVSSSLENLISLPDGFVYKSNNKEEFLSNIFYAFSNDNDDLREKRIQESSLHTWDSKGNELFDILVK